MKNTGSHNGYLRFKYEANARTKAGPQWSSGTPLDDG